MTPNVRKRSESMRKGLRKWWPELESNQRHKDFQSSALPTELSGHEKKENITEASFLCNVFLIFVQNKIKLRTCSKSSIG